MPTAAVRAIFWLAALLVTPTVGFFAGVGVSGGTRTSDVVAWVLLLGFPAASTFGLGWLLGVPATERVVAAVISTAVSGLFLILLLWYLFEVVRVS